MQDGSVIRLPDGSTWRAPSLASADRERVRWHGFEAFVRMALPHLPGIPARPLWNWHFEELCRHAQALYEGRCTVLNTTLPPGTGKSRINAVLFPVYLWTQDAAIHTMTATYNLDLVREFATDTLDLMGTAWFQERWGNLLKDQKSEPNLEHIRSKRGGVRYALTAPKGKGTGIHGDYYILDDLIRAHDAEMPGALKKVGDWIGTSVVSRGRMTGPIKILSGMQRLAVDDPAAKLRDAYEGLATYVELMLPYRFEPERRCVTPFGGDRRHVEGELLWDAPFLRSTAQGIERMSGGPNSQASRAQLQQDPKGGDDAIFDSKYFERFTLTEVPFVKCLTTVLSVDPTFTNGKAKKGKRLGDFVAMEVWGVLLFTGGRIGFYCYHSEEARRGFNETIGTIIATRAAWRTSFVLVELAAAGDPIVQELERIGIHGVVGIEVQGGGDSPVGKLQKAKVASAYFKARLVHFLKDAPWYARKARNLERFPNGPHDDDVDTTTQALLWLMNEFGFSAGWTAAVQGWESELKQLEDGTASAQPEAMLIPELSGIIDVDGTEVPILVE
jgi:predicted phage terminase large subunit-like protein